MNVRICLSRLSPIVGPGDKPEKKGRLWRRQSLPKFNTKLGKANGKLTPRGSLRLRSKNTLNMLSKMIPSSPEDTSKQDSKDNTEDDVNNLPTYTSLRNISGSKEEEPDDSKIIEAESVA